MKYGITYQGSKDKIADDIIELLPRGKRFVDLFGGGFAITHAAMMHNRWKNYLYNELNPLLVDLIKRGVRGDFNYSRFTPEWISREKFAELKDKDGYVKYVWSFGCSGQDYMYSKEVEPWKKALHYARVFKDYSLLREFGIESLGSSVDIKQHLEAYKQKYIIWYCKNVLHSSLDVLELQKNLTERVQKNSEELRDYLIKGLKSAGKTASQVDRYLGTNGMAGHYFGKSQWEFPTREVYIKLQDFLDLPTPYEEIYGLQDLLQSLQSLQSLEIRCGSYLDYEYQDGDVVYCDPPYEGTAEYDDSFNHKEFYDWVTSRPYPVYFSSYGITDSRFFIVWEKVKYNLLCNTQEKKKKSLERVYCNQPIKTTLFDMWG